MSDFFLPIGITFLLMIVCSGISYLQSHRLEKDLLLASIRVIIQLLILGFVLQWLFAHTSPVYSIVAAILMTVNSALHSSSRVSYRYKGLFLDNLVATALALWPLTFLGSVLLWKSNWWLPESFLPLIGMLLGNTLNGLAMGVDHFTRDLRDKKDEVQTLLSLGASVHESTQQIFSKSLRTALSPTLNSMLSMGLVSIPGMMTGQLLAGVSPVEASLTQIILMFLIASGTYLGTLSGLSLSRGKLFNKKGQPCWS